MEASKSCIYKCHSFTSSLCKTQSLTMIFSTNKLYISDFCSHTCKQTYAMHIWFIFKGDTYLVKFLPSEVYEIAISGRPVSEKTMVPYLACELHMDLCILS